MVKLTFQLPKSEAAGYSTRLRMNEGGGINV
jgi:hypothetical protein